MSDELFAQTKKFALTDESDISYYKQKYLLPDYCIEFVNKAAYRLELSGKNVLEIGGSNLPIELVVKKCNAKKWVCVDLPWVMRSNKVSEHPHYKDVRFATFKNNDLEDELAQQDYIVFTESAHWLPKSFHGKFDVVLSNCCFEHVVDLPLVIEQCYKALKPGGMLWTRFGPIYSGPNGNHVDIFDKKLDFTLTKADYPKELHHLHLLLNYKELYDYLTKQYGKHIADKYVYTIKHGQHYISLNHLFYEDYEHIMQQSAFKKFVVAPRRVIDIDESNRATLEKMFPGYLRFDARTIEISAIKK